MICCPHKQHSDIVLSFTESATFAKSKTLVTLVCETVTQLSQYFMGIHVPMRFALMLAFLQRQLAAADGHNEAAVVAVEPSETVDSDEYFRLKRKAQTEKGRFAAMKKHLVTRKTDSDASEAEESQLQLEDRVQQACFAHHSKGAPRYSENRSLLRRGLLAFLKAFSTYLNNLIKPEGSGVKQHVVSFNIMDDCSIRLGNRKSNSSSVHTVCNNYQRILVRSQVDTVACIRLHQPMMVMVNASTEVIHSTWTAWLLVSARGVGPILQKLGILPTCESALKCLVLMSDGLVTNDACFAIEVGTYLQSRQLLFCCVLISVFHLSTH
jgi:hypothetical protein